MNALRPEADALHHADPGDWQYECPRCHERYRVRLLGDICHDCAAADRRAAEKRAQWRRTCGVSVRHSKLLAWADLHGPDDYMRAVQAVRRFAETGDSILALIGHRGTGKSQLGCVAVWQEIERGGSARRIGAAALLGNLKGRYGERGDVDADWLAEWCAPRLLAIDEAAELVGSDYTRSQLTALLDARYERCKPTIVIGNLEPDALPDVLGASVADRIWEGGGYVHGTWPSFRGAAR